MVCQFLLNIGDGRVMGFGPQNNDRRKVCWFGPQKLGVNSLVIWASKPSTTYLFGLVLKTEVEPIGSMKKNLDQFGRGEGCLGKVHHVRAT
jgi:hypothetical protein